MVRSLLSAAVKGEHNQKYEDAVKMLNTLQSNAQALEKIRQDRDKFAHLNVPNMLKFAERAGIVEADMNRLNVIHVSGTKGKGSTCAFSESILRHHGYKTGFFSSPHLVEVRERFCVNGSPLERDKFASYFWEVFNKLDKSKLDCDGAMPNYFGFLTVMALHVFLKEEVDVAVMEVGLGGEFDSTNLIKNPVVCGVTSLGLDHTSILGTSIDKIAWHKAGIFKTGVPAFTAPQVPEAMQVLKDRAAQIGAPLVMCSDMSQYETQCKLGIKGNIQKVNAYLALQLCNTWMNKHEGRSLHRDASECSKTDCDRPGPPSTLQQSHGDIRQAEPVALTPKLLQGLEKCQWLGRNQTVKEPGVTFYIDGAHTKESIQQCVDWFNTDSKEESSQSKDGVYKVLVFNTTRDREASQLLKPLLECKFDTILFCPNIAYEGATSADQTNVALTNDKQLERCLENKNCWEQLNIKSNQIQADDIKPNMSSQNGEMKISSVNSDYKSDYTCVNQPHLETTESHQIQADNVKSTAASNIRGLNGELKSTSVNGDFKSDCVHGKQSQSETYIFPSVSHCINWVCKRQREVEKENEKPFNGDKLLSDGKEVVDSLCSKDDIISQKRKLVSRHSDNVQNCEHDVGGGGDDQHIGRRHVQVLITGSLHLVGSTLRVLWDRQM